MCQYVFENQGVDRKIRDSGGLAAGEPVTGQVIGQNIEILFQQEADDSGEESNMVVVTMKKKKKVPLASDFSNRWQATL